MGKSSETDARVLEEIRRFDEKLLAIQHVCAALIGELALSTPDPRAKLERMIEGLTATAIGVSDGADQDTSAYTATIAFICDGAERGLSHLRREPQTASMNRL